MKTSTIADLRIIGDSSASGGNYNNARVIGDSIVNGNLSCIRFKCVGNSKINGNLKANETRIVGSASIMGRLKSGDVRVAGNIDVSGDIDSENIVIHGGIDAKRGIKSNNIRIGGYATIKQNCEAESFISEGQLTIGGLLNTGDTDIRIHSLCRINEIGGERIIIRRGHGSKLEQIFKSLFLADDRYGARLVTDCIEGDEIRLEHTKAKVVRGKNVVVGDGCEIDLVEYENEFRTHGKPVVKEQRKVK